jgi:hypothetical protein
MPLLPQIFGEVFGRLFVHGFFGGCGGVGGKDDVFTVLPSANVLCAGAFVLEDSLIRVGDCGAGIVEGEDFLLFIE